MKLDEQELSRAMDDAVGGVRPATGDLVEGATRTGQRLRVRRRMAVGTVAFAVTGAVLGVPVFGAYLPTYTGGEVRAAMPSAPGGGMGGVEMPDFSKVPRPPTAPPPGKQWLSGRATVQILRDLLPNDRSSSDYEGQDGPEHYPATTFGRLGTGWPAGAEVQVNVDADFGRNSAALGEDLEEFYSCEGREPEGRMTACGVTALADGSVLIMYEDRSGLLLRRHADLLRADGMRVAVGTANGVDIEDGPVIGLEPPLSLDEMRDIATSPRWQIFVDLEVNERAKELEPYKDRTQYVPPGGSIPTDDRQGSTATPSTSTRH
ncbi:hypothetical protein [Streptomyces sp. NPDC002889]|uniref:hypothetical protein n=1 Tax=Streptomyces sp. NPDC002889 TaxID=3364669 RepID=UPI0036C3C019